jgi:hypothetical protein
MKGAIMSNLDVYTPGGGLFAVSSTSSGLFSTPTQKAIARVQSQGLVRAAASDVEAVLSQVKLGAAASIGRSAQHEVALLTSMELELAKLVPEAAGRIDAIASITAIQMAEIVADSLIRLRRI